MTAKTTAHPAEAKPSQPKRSSEESEKPFSLPEYLKGVRTEWGKITWPSTFQIVSQTIVVLVMVTVMTLALWLTDRVLHDGVLCNVIPNGQERCAQQK